MGKLIVLSLDESEQQVYDKIMKIVDCAGISIEKKLGGDHEEIHNGELSWFGARSASNACGFQYLGKNRLGRFL